GHRSRTCNGSCGSQATTNTNALILPFAFLCLFVAKTYVEKRRNMDSTLAGAARIFVRRGLHLLRPPDTTRLTYRRVRFVVRSRVTRVGRGSYPKKRTTRDLWPVRLHTQSALSRQLFTRPWLHDRVGPARPRATLRGPVSWHLFAGDARRS